VRKTIEAVVTLAFASFASTGTAATSAGTQFLCSGAKVDAARKISQKDNLKLGMDPKACFGEMKLTESDRRQIVVAAPSSECKTGKLLDVYDRSRAGPYHSLFEKPVCGTNISAGPRTQAGDMITIDGRQYWEKGAHYVPYK
jgi:hypothetical protein